MLVDRQVDSLDIDTETHSLTHKNCYSSNPLLPDTEKDILDGKIYDKLMEKVGAKDRGKFKAKFFSDFYYADNQERYSKDSKITIATQELYPDLYKYVIWKKEELGSFKELPRLMQKRESDLVIKKMGTELARAKVKAYSIHDSFLCKKSDVDFIVSKFKEVMPNIPLKVEKL